MQTSNIIRERIDNLNHNMIILSSNEVASLNDEIDLIISRIRSSSEYNEAESHLDELGRLQELLALLYFKYDVSLSAKQKKLVCEYDRADDQILRTMIFAAVKDGKFP